MGKVGLAGVSGLGQGSASGSDNGCSVSTEITKNVASSPPMKGEEKLLKDSVAQGSGKSGSAHHAPGKARKASLEPPVPTSNQSQARKTGNEMPSPVLRMPSQRPDNFDDPPSLHSVGSRSTGPIPLPRLHGSPSTKYNQTSLLRPGAYKIAGLGEEVQEQKEEEKVEDFQEQAAPVTSVVTDSTEPLSAEASVVTASTAVASNAPSQDHV